MIENKLIITPKTKISDLLEAYPQLEEIITKLVPALEKLKNPVLRKTIGKVSNLQQIAVMGNMGVDKLMIMLRKEVGQDLVEEIQKAGYESAEKTPEWFNKNKVEVTFDVRPMLEAGEHPVHQVMSDLNQLENGKIYQITASFLPVPLIEKAKSIGFTDYIEKIKDNEYNVFFFKNTSTSTS